MNENTEQTQRLLREKAEAIYSQSAAPGGDVSSADVKTLHHNLAVHQIELELQNEELRRAQQQLEIARDRYAQLYQQAPVGYLTLDPSGIILQCNQTFAGLAGEVEKDLTGRSLASFLTNPDKNIFLGRFKAFYRSPEGKHMDLAMDRKGGAALFVRITGRLETKLVSSRQDLLEPCLLVIVNDITAQHRLEEENARTHQRNLSILESIADAFFSLDDNMVVTYFNTAAEKALGRPRHEIIGHPLFDAFPQARGSVFEVQYTRALRERTPGSFEAHFGVPPYENWYAVRVYPFDQGLSVYFQIITHLKRAEAEKARLEDQLHQSQKLESIGRLAGGVAHDFNNMLQAIQMNASLAEKDIPAGHPIHDNLTEIQKCARRSADLTSQLLGFARKQPIAPKMLDINETVEALLKMVRRLIGEDIDLVWIPGNALGMVKMDPTQIVQIVTNLCANARDAIGGVGKIIIKTEVAAFDEAFNTDYQAVSPGRYVQLSIGDSGCGMDRETMAHIFEPFFTTKAFGKGTGLGLATVYGIVNQNSGFIQLKSEPAKGTTFGIFLPEQRFPAAAAETSAPVVPSRRSGETILVVEDEPSILASVHKVLQWMGYNVLISNSPLEAIKLLQGYSGLIDLLITDVVMPEMNGRDLARQILTQRPYLKCLFMSGYMADIVGKHGVLDKDMHFIQKPFSVDDLIPKVRAILETR